MSQIVLVGSDQGPCRDKINPITMRIREACQFTGISRSTLYVLIGAGEVEIVKLGATTLVLTESLLGLIDRNRVKSTACQS